MPNSSTKLAQLLPIMIVVGSLFSNGCIRDRYFYGAKGQSPTPIQSGRNSQVYYGKPQPYLDRVEKFVQHPFKTIGSKIGLAKPVAEPDQEFDPSRSENVYLAKQYLADNGLSDVDILVRDYNPSDQWRRLKKNQSISPILKYTDGLTYWLRYRLIPHRPLQEDHYNPYTNTLHINSPDAVSTLYQASMAKKFREKRFPGLYSVLQWAPFVPVYHHSDVSSEALSYASRQSNRHELLGDLYPHAYAQVGSSAISSVMSNVPSLSNQPFYVAPIVQIAGGAASRKTGSILAEQYQEEAKTTKQPAPNSTFIPSWERR